MDKKNFEEGDENLDDTMKSFKNPTGNKNIRTKQVASS